MPRFQPSAKKTANKSAIEQAALRLLAIREHSQLELRQKLAKHYPTDLIQKVIAELQSKGYQSDERFALAYARHRYRKGQGPVKIRLELRQKGIDDDLIAASLAQPELDWEAALQAALHKRFGSQPPSSPSERAKQQRFLAQRGFANDMIHHYFNQRF